ncbi:hypothetical protein DIPPA_11651 [Diplonema papillatum]|nr:hypothetical protein DIPPA_11651 [Diplonema papillatum]
MGKKEDDLKLKNKMASKPGSVSIAVDWGTKDDSGGAFTTVSRRKGVSASSTTPKPQPVAVAVAQRRDEKFVPASYVPGAEVVEKKTKKAPKPAPKQQQQQQQKATASKGGPEAEAAWSTISKNTAKKPAGGMSDAMKEFMQTEKQRKYEQERRKQAIISANNNAVVGAAPVESAAEKKKLEREAKKRQKELDKMRLQQMEKQQKQTQGDGFAAVAKGVKAPKQAPKDVSHFGSATAFSMLGKKADHMKVPKKHKGREAIKVSEDQIQDMLRKQYEQLTKKPDDVEVDFKVHVQGKWYDIKSLLAANDFAHAPKLVQAAVNQPKVQGGFFIGQHGKSWAMEKTVDDWWMSTTYLTGLQKLLTTLEPQLITPYWAGEKDGKDAATAKLTIQKNTLQDECYPSMTLVHVQRHASALQEVQCSVHQFVTAIIEEGKRLVTFLEKVESAVDELAESKKFQSKDKQTRLKEFRASLPSKIESHVTNLTYAFNEFDEKHSIPKPKEAEDDEEKEPEQEGDLHVEDVDAPAEQAGEEAEEKQPEEKEAAEEEQAEKEA